MLELVTEQPTRHSIKDSPISYHFAAMLSQHSWSCFCVFTTYYPLRSDRARTLMNQMFYDLTLTLGYSPKLFWVAEKAPRKDNFHLHALVELDMPQDIACEIVEQSWKRVSKAGSYMKRNASWVKPFEYERNCGSHYVSKQLNHRKEEIDWDFVF